MYNSRSNSADIFFYYFYEYKEVILHLYLSTSLISTLIVIYF